MPSLDLRFYAADANSDIRPLPLDENKNLNFEQGADNALSIWQQPIRVVLKALDQVKADKEQPEAPAGIVNILFVKTNHLQEPAFYYKLSGPNVAECKESKAKKVSLRATHNSFGGNNELVTDEAYPIVTIGFPDIMSVYEESPGLDFDIEVPYWKDSRKEERWKYDLGSASQVKFLDSSIWHRYVPYNVDDFQARLEKVLGKIAYAYQMKLYTSVAARSTLEFQCRMLQNSTIGAFGSRGHHEAVTPFKFHSETEMENKVARYEQFFAKEFNGQTLRDAIKWNVLLVDDYSEDEIYQYNIGSETASKPENQGVSPLSKQALIKYLTRNIGVEIGGYTKGQDRIISQGVAAIQKQTFDIILLDYLIGDDEEHHGHKAYGHEFLLELATNSGRNQFKRGPFGRFWIYPISSFPFAFHDKLRQLNVDGSDDRWHISSGGDPINTPALFQLNLYRLMMRQISECYLHEAALMRQISRYDGIGILGQWCSAILARLNSIDQMKNLLAADRDADSKFAETMEVFLEAQQADYDFFERLKRWITAFSYYQTGQSAAANFDDLQRICSEYPKFESICNKIKKQAGTFIADATAALSKLPEVKERGPGIVEFNARRLYAFPEQFSGNPHNVKEMDLSTNYLLGLPSAICTFTALRDLNLSYNRDLKYLPADEMLKALHALEQLNLEGTTLGKEMREKCLIVTTKKQATKNLLKHIAAHNERNTHLAEFLEPNTKAKKVFIAYAHQDERWKDELEKHLAPLVYDGSITLWDKSQMKPSDFFDTTIQNHLMSSHIILFLLSPDFVASPYLMSGGITKILSTNKIAIPIYLRPCEVPNILKKHTGLPLSEDEPIVSSAYANKDEGFRKVAKGLRDKILQETTQSRE